MANASVRDVKGTSKVDDYRTYLPGDAKATFNQAALDIGMCSVYNFNRVLPEMTIHVFPAYAFCKQKRYLCRHPIKPKSIRLLSFISRLQELNAYLADFPPDIKGQKPSVFL